jgi:predicted Zn finger-like uncharacterized protein
MNIVCDRCSARFSVADDQIGDRTWKARCRRCGHRLLVRRVAPSAKRPAAPPSAGDSEDPLAIWYVVIGQEQMGPMTGAELRRRFAAGEILPSFYVWCEGYEEWLPIEMAPGLKDLMAPIDQSGPATRRVRAEDRSQGRIPGSASDSEAGAESEAHDTVIQHVSMDSPAGARGGGRSEKTQRVSLDDIVAMYPAEAEPLLTGTAPPQPGSRGRSGNGPTLQLKGQRSEHSVLFRIGSDDDEDEAEPASGEVSPPSGDASRHEGTGLVDVREMARTEFERAGAEVTDKLVVSAPTTLTTPVVAPIGHTGLPRWIWGVMAGVVIGVGLLAALVTALILRTR